MKKYIPNLTAFLDTSAFLYTSVASLNGTYNFSQDFLNSLRQASLALPVHRQHLHSTEKPSQSHHIHFSSSPQNLRAAFHETGVTLTVSVASTRSSAVWTGSAMRPLSSVFAVSLCFQEVPQRGHTARLLFSMRNVLKPDHHRTWFISVSP